MFELFAFVFGGVAAGGFVAWRLKGDRTMVETIRALGSKGKRTMVETPRALGGGPGPRDR